MVDEQRMRRHFILEGVTTAEPFKREGRGSAPNVPSRDRDVQAANLRSQLADVSAYAEEAKAVQADAGLTDGIGIQVEFRSFAEVHLLAERLERQHMGIELLSVREDEETMCTHATVFVPDGRLGHFERVVRDYANERTDSAGRRQDNRLLVDAIEEIRSATLRALWTDAAEEFPTDEHEAIWWEVWLQGQGDQSAVIASFRERMAMIERGSAVSHDSRGSESQTDLFMPLDSAPLPRPRVGEGELRFPERAVLLVYATAEQLRSSMPVLNSIAELRRPKDTAAFFDALSLNEQQEWVDDLRSRTTFAASNANVPYVCLFDTGVNRGHPLLAPSTASNDLHTVNPSLGVDDSHGHGTQMAGLALLGDLVPLLESNDAVAVKHRLESVKLFDDEASTSADATHHGYLMQEAVARPELAAPRRRRVFGMAVTASHYRDRGKPSAWSAAIDALAADVDGNGEVRRLIVTSAGNAKSSTAEHYPDGNDTEGVQDPAQAWNALVVGAYTERTNIAGDGTDGYSPVAPEGGLSPFSTTSLTWQSKWPMKPDVVLEGGNMASDHRGPIEMQSLDLLTTNHRPAERLLTTIRATSAATALGCRMVAQVAAAYPELWPETIRALIVHSAEWTDAMKRTYLTSPVTKERYEQLIRRCGFGVPNLDRALHSASDSLTMVVQKTLTPYQRASRGQPKLRELHLHRLPWPTSALADLGETPVKMRVTLSYYIEPNPSRRGHGKRYAYESHGLRFDVRRPTETIDGFHRRINAAARAEDGGRPPRSSDPHWLIGTQRRHKGSLHSDIWQGTAAELASRDTIAVYPTSGWWKTRRRLERYALPAPYALVVSIEAPETNVDLYAEVANLVGSVVEVA